jgi:hypothetical protein
MNHTPEPGTSPATPPSGQMTEAEFRALYDRLHSQPPWDPTTGAGP